MQTAIDTRALELATRAEQIARDARDQCRNEYEGLRAEFTLHRQETSLRFDRQDIDRKQMHAENQQKFEKLFRALYIATGVLLAASALMSHGAVDAIVRFLIGH